MFPAWQKALRNALENIKSNGDLYILVFWDGQDLSVWFDRLGAWWFGLLKVYYRPEFLEFLKKLQHEGAGKYTVQTVGTSYAFMAHFRKNTEN